MVCAVLAVLAAEVTAEVVAGVAAEEPAGGGDGRAAVAAVELAAGKGVALLEASNAVLSRSLICGREKRTFAVGVV